MTCLLLRKSISLEFCASSKTVFFFFFQVQGHQMYVILVSHIQQMLI